MTNPLNFSLKKKLLVDGESAILFQPIASDKLNYN